MASTQHPDRHVDAGELALEAIRLGARLDDNHPADPGGLESIGTCRNCGYLIFEGHSNGWRHLPSVEELDTAGRWLAAHPNGS